MKWIVSLVLILVIASFAGCLKSSSGSSTVTCGWDSCNFKAPASEIASLKTALMKSDTAAIQQCSGLFYHVIDSGTGTRPTPCSTVTVTYIGKLNDSTGTTFDQGTTSLSLISVIPGWRDGLPLIKSNGRILLYIPPTLGYGSTAFQSIPGNSVLYFDIRLTAVQ